MFKAFIYKFFFLLQGNIIRVFNKNSFKEKFDYEHIYPTIHDAILTILRRNKSNIVLVSKRKSTININIGEEELQPNVPEPIYHPRRRQSNIFEELTLIKTELPPIEENP